MEVQIAGHTIFIDPEDLDLLDGHSWHPIMQKDCNPVQYVLAYCTSRPDKANEYLHRLVAARIGITGNVGAVNRNPLDVRRENLRPSGKGLPAGPRGSRNNPGPQRDFGIGRHSVGDEHPPVQYLLCDAPHIYGHWNTYCEHPHYIGEARRAPAGWQARLWGQHQFGPVFRRFYDAVKWADVVRLAR